MKADKTIKMYKKLGLGIFDPNKSINKQVKAIIVNFGDERGDIIIKNENFGTRKKYPDFTEGKKKAGIHPMQIVYSGALAHELHEKFINEKGQICEF